MTRFIDLSHEIADGMTTYPGLPAPAITTHVSREESGERLGSGASFHIGRIDMIANTGTYLDSPWHFHEDGVDLSGLDLERLAGLPLTVVRRSDAQPAGIEHDALPATSIAGHAVLFHTGWDRHWGTDAYGTGAPFLSADLVAALVERGVALAGIDSVNIDDVTDGSRPAHSRLLGNGIAIVEHLTNLGELPEGDAGCRFFAVPPKVRAFGTFPVRAFAMCD
jgi:kynurenine formamidase